MNEMRDDVKNALKHTLKAYAYSFGWVILNILRVIVIIPVLVIEILLHNTGRVFSYAADKMQDFVDYLRDNLPVFKDGWVDKAELHINKAKTLTDKHLKGDDYV